MNGWIGVDLDGTLATYDGWRGEMHIGAPVPRMVRRVKRWLAEGRVVKIFTARAFCASEPALRNIEAWCEEHIGVILPITCMKDHGMVELWDDCCVQVMTNTGKRADGWE